MASVKLRCFMCDMPVDYGTHEDCMKEFIAKSGQTEHEYHEQCVKYTEALPEISKEEWERRDKESNGTDEDKSEGELEAMERDEEDGQPRPTCDPCADQVQRWANAVSDDDLALVRAGFELGMAMEIKRSPWEDAWWEWAAQNARASLDNGKAQLLRETFGGAPAVPAEVHRARFAGKPDHVPSWFDNQPKHFNAQLLIDLVPCFLSLDPEGDENDLKFAQGVIRSLRSFPDGDLWACAEAEKRLEALWRFKVPMESPTKGATPIAYMHFAAAKNRKGYEAVMAKYERPNA